MNIPLVLLNNIYTYQEHLGAQSRSTTRTKTTAEETQQWKRWSWFSPWFVESKNKFEKVILEIRSVSYAWKILLFGSIRKKNVFWSYLETGINIFYLNIRNYICISRKFCAGQIINIRYADNSKRWNKFIIIGTRKIVGVYDSFRK